MFLIDALSDFFLTLQSTFVNIPTDNFLGELYVALNFVLQLFAAISGGGTTDGGFPLGGGDLPF